MMEVNQIKELFKGHYQVILDFPTPTFLKSIIDDSYKFIWGIEHNEGGCEWEKYDHTIYGVSKNSNVLCRNIFMEYLIETQYFSDYIKHINQTVKITQINNIPPPYFDVLKLKGKSKYDLYKEKLNYKFEIEIPGATDYAQIISPDISFLEEVIKKAEFLL